MNFSTLAPISIEGGCRTEQVNLRAEAAITWIDHGIHPDEFIVCT